MTITWLETLVSGISCGQPLRDLSNAFAVPVSWAGIERLSQFLWNYLAEDNEAPPRRVGTGPHPQSIFYASGGTYNLGHTCNTWTAEALRAAGFPVITSGVVFAGQVLDQLRPLLEPISNSENIH